MEEVAFGDWPGQPVEWNVGNNPWLPAYGMHAPSELMREDFGGNPDADYFLPGSCGGNSYAYLETILEETSDDLRSETDTDSRGSPVGWLATDSESGSVICLDQSEDCDSDREIACPAKRRKHENFLTVQIDDEEESISRSSSLLQFETLEKECQESSSPSIFSQFSFDSLESTNNRQKTNVSPDSLNSPNSEDEADFFKNITLTSNKRDNFSNSRSESSDSDTTIENSRSYDNLKTWRSFESLSLNNSNNVINNKKDDKVSAENLSEDSGYSDHLSKSSGNLERKMKNESEEIVKRNMGRTYGSRFGAYDGDGFQNFTGNFGVSYQDLTAFDKLDPQPTPTWRSSPLIDAFLRKKLAAMSTDDSPKIHQCAIFDSRSSSAPELVDRAGRNGTPEVLCRSAPEGLEHLEEEENKGQSGCGERRVSVAEQDLDIGDISVISDMANYRREGSYEQAMANRVDLSDDENSLRYKKRLPKTPIIEFDRRVLKAISEQSIQSLQSSNHSLNNFNAIKDELRSPKPRRPHNNYLSTSSTPNLNKLEICPKYIDIEDKGKSVHEVNHVCQREEEKYVVPDFEVLRPKSPEDIDSNVIIRKGSIIKSSTSTSGMSDDGEKTLRNSVKSFTGSTGSKGVHFSPVVSEVNWQDNASNSTATPDRESSYSLRSSSSSPEPEKPPAPPVVLKPKPKYGSPARRTVSQPDLSETDTMDEFNSNLQQLLKVDVSKSQPDVSSMRRRGSKLLKRAGDGAVLAAYVDRDGIQYKHTHLGAPTSTSTVNNTGKNPPGNTGPGSARAAAGGTATAGTMEAEQRQKRDSRGKIGGFLQRLASFRFGGKRDKEKQKRKDGAVGSVATQTRTHQPRIATKDDYIYIPLKGPNVTTSKPPLPRQPPRVVHASAKNGAPAQRRRTVDAAPVAMEPPAGLIETDLDTEVTVITGGNGSNGTKTRSMLSLVPGEQMEKRHRPHKSMEFLLDKQNLKVVEPPENELQKGERVMSEHQLRVQRSLQKLTVPEWYKNSPVPREGFLLKKNSARESRWTGTSNKTTSLSSLGSTNQSPLALSPTPCTQPFVRWSTSKLNSTASSPCQSTRASFNVNTNRQTSPGGSARSSFSYRQPYLGWRSQERLSRPRTPAERLASSILDGRRDDELDSKNHENQVASPEIQIGIKEVTSAIVHYVSGRRPDALDAPSRSPGSSPRGSQKLCWLESSFVGTRPPDSPQTPAGIQSSEINEDGRDQGLRLDLQTHNGKVVRA